MQLKMSHLKHWNFFERFKNLKNRRIVEQEQQQEENKDVEARDQ